MLKSIDEVLSSQTKLYRVKQGRERGPHGYLNKRYMYVFLKPFVIRFIPAACVLSFVDSKAQSRYLGSPNVAVPP